MKDKNATRMYCYANSLTLRSSPDASSNYNEIGNVTYGTQVLIYKDNGEWVECKVNNTEGYVFDKYLLSYGDFRLMNSIFQDKTARDAIVTTKCKRALLNYFKERSIIGRMSPEMQKEIYGRVSEGNQWEIISKAKGAFPNTVFYPQVVNPGSKFTDFAVIIRNTSNGDRRTILFSFDDFGNSTIASEQMAPKTGDIKSIWPSYYNGERIYKIKYQSRY